MIRIFLFLLVIFIFISPIFLFIKLVKKKARKQIKTSWKGKLVDKKHLEYEDDDSSYTRDVYSLFFKTTKGEQVKINVSKEIFDSWIVGDKATKTEGKLHPEKIK